ncbi:MAG: MFS transporter [Planctomycetes bacterium]|nr:MFS transporter [Planctomycetota bacterium]
MEPASAATTREKVSWCLFDFANSAFNTVVTTFVYSVFFAQVLVGDELRGNALWADALVISGLAVAAFAPVLGARADQIRGKKLYLVLMSGVVIAATALLYIPGVAPGADRASPFHLALALVLVVTANVAFEAMFVFYNAFLPGLGDAATIGRLSGYGWGLGYAGGLLCLALCLGMIGFGGIPAWLPADGHVNVRATNLLVAGWFLVFALPAFLFLRDRTPRNRPAATVGAWAQVLATVRALRGYPDLLRLLVARLLYNDALLALIGLAGLYMGTTLGMGPGQIVLLAILLNVIAGVGAVGFGYLDDRIGARISVLASIGLLGGGTLLAIAIPTQGAFYVAAVLVGLGMGPNQSASRTLLARFTPAGRESEFAGLFALSGKAANWIAALAYGLLIRATGEQRLALLPIVVLFALGAVLAWPIDEARGRARAAA